MAPRINELTVLIRGGGEMSSGIAHRLRCCQRGAVIPAPIPGLTRGMLHSGVRVRAGMKIGDIDPRLERGYCYEISDKARAIGGGVLEAILGASIDLKLPSD